MRIMVSITPTSSNNPAVLNRVSPDLTESIPRDFLSSRTPYQIEYKHYYNSNYKGT